MASVSASIIALMLRIVNPVLSRRDFNSVCHGDIARVSNLLATCFNLGATKIVSRWYNKIRPYDSLINWLHLFTTDISLS